MRRTVAFALTASAAVGVSLGACKSWLQELPVEYKLRTPCATGDPGLSCKTGVAHRPKMTAVEDKRFAFDGAGHTWRTQGAAFDLAQPITARSIPASLVTPRWTDAQRRDLPKGAHDAALVPLGGNYWARTDYPIVSAEGESWVSSRYAGPAIQDRGNALTGSMWMTLHLDQSILRVAIGGDADEPPLDEKRRPPGAAYGQVGVELLVAPSTATAAAQCLKGRRGERFALPPPQATRATSGRSSGTRTTKRHYEPSTLVSTHPIVRCGA